MTSMDTERSRIRLCLSRSTYPINTSVVGCINVSPDLRLSSLKVFVAGRARLDSRWFDIQSVKKRYGTHPCHDDLPTWVEKVAEEGCFNGGDRTKGKNESICFWSTNVLNLYENESIVVPHVDNDQAEDDKPKPLAMSGSEWFNRASRYLENLQGDVDKEEPLEYDSESDSSSDSNSSYESESEEEVSDESGLRIQDTKDKDDDSKDNAQTDLVQTDSINARNALNFTFRSDLPDDIVPTLNAVCARYYYSVVVFAKQMNGKTIVVQAPFTVVAPTKKTCALQDCSFTKTQILIGSMFALSHTKNYLVPLSVTYKAEPISISVKRSQGWNMSNQKSIPIEENGLKCGTLTIIGGGLMVPGESICLKYTASDESDNMNFLPCYQVSACLQGEEYAIGMKGGKKRSKTFVFDTDFEKVCPDTTTGVSLSLNLPLHCPITISTDFVEINVTCRIDFTVKTPGCTSFRFLTVEFPCRVVQSAPEEEELENGLSPSLENKILDLKWPTKEHAVHRQIFSSETLNDLNMLSLHLLNKPQTA